MTKKQDQLNHSFAAIIACDKANEIMELYKNNKRSSKYDDQLFDYLKSNNGEGTFYLSSKIDRYVQEDERTAEKQENDPYFVLYIDEHPVFLIRAQANEDPDQKWEYYDYPVNDKKLVDLIRTGKFYVLNASNYGLYLIGENDYYPISGSPFEEENFLEQVKKLNISLSDMKIEKNILDLNLIGNLKVTVKDYDYNTLSETDIENIRKYMEDNGEDFKGCTLIGPIPMYQYGFTSLNEIEVCDNNRENDSLCFKLVNNNKVTGYLHYDPYDDGCDSQIEYDPNEADKAEKDIYKYYESLSPLGYIFADKILCENTDDPDYSLIDKKIAEKIQSKIKEEERKFNEYSIN